MLTRRDIGLALLSGAALAAAPGAEAAAEQTSAVQLPPPSPGRGMPLMAALRLRRSTREYDADRKLSLQVLSDLLWAAFGINRPASGDRTAPSWRHAIETEIYGATAEGVWRYEPASHRLLPHLREDIRAQTGTQDFVGSAPLNLIYVADGTRMHGATRENQRFFASTDSGFIGQNVYLFCAAEGLATVFRASVDREALGRTLRLPSTHFITYAQSVGYPRG